MRDELAALLVLVYALQRLCVQGTFKLRGYMDLNTLPKNNGFNLYQLQFFIIYFYNYYLGHRELGARNL